MLSWLNGSNVPKSSGKLSQKYVVEKQKSPNHLISEDEWRLLGVQQSLGWVCHMIHKTEPHILLFRQPLPKH
uniref:Cyclin-dependent kinases regulatory subunit n=1 Tax=Oncorhynchus kisutch TaxID=8019 RepID=A0A8C7CDP2_ONCKI